MVDNSNLKGEKKKSDEFYTLYLYYVNKGQSIYLICMKGQNLIKPFQSTHYCSTPDGEHFSVDIEKVF